MDDWKSGGTCLLNLKRRTCTGSHMQTDDKKDSCGRETISRLGSNIPHSYVTEGREDDITRIRTSAFVMPINKIKYSSFTCSNVYDVMVCCTQVKLSDHSR